MHSQARTVANRPAVVHIVRAVAAVAAVVISIPPQVVQAIGIMHDSVASRTYTTPRPCSLEIGIADVVSIARVVDAVMQSMSRTTVAAIMRPLSGAM